MYGNESEKYTCMIRTLLSWVTRVIIEVVLCKLISLGMPKMIGWLSFVALGKEMLGNNMRSVMCEPVHSYKLTRGQGESAGPFPGLPCCRRVTWVALRGNQLFPRGDRCII